MLDRGSREEWDAAGGPEARIGACDVEQAGDGGASRLQHWPKRQKTSLRMCLAANRGRRRDSSGRWDAHNRWRASTWASYQLRNGQFVRFLTHHLHDCRNPDAAYDASPRGRQQLLMLILAARRVVTRAITPVTLLHHGTGWSCDATSSVTLSDRQWPHQAPPRQQSILHVHQVRGTPTPPTCFASPKPTAGPGQR